MNETEEVKGIAPLRNVAAFLALAERVTSRRSSLPGMAAFYGKSGLGKSISATYAANKYRAYVVAVKSSWTKKHFCVSILREMGIPETGNSIPMMLDTIAQQLAMSRRPLIIDEADFLVQRGMIELVRDIYESSYAGIILIGEENLPGSLMRWERVHNRMLDWVKALPCNESDLKMLAKIYCPGVDVADDLLGKISESVQGCTRRIVVNLDHVLEFSRVKGLEQVDLANYKGRIDSGAQGGR